MTNRMPLFPIRGPDLRFPSSFNPANFHTAIDSLSQLAYFPNTSCFHFPAQGKGMDSKNYSDEAGAILDEAAALLSKHISRGTHNIYDLQIAAPSARDESYLFDLIGRIDHKVLQGCSLYIQIRGIAYKVLYGVYWRSVYSDEQFWGLRCEEIERGMWAEGNIDTNCIDLPIQYTEEGWTVEEQSLQYLLNRDLPLFENTIS